MNSHLPKVTQQTALSHHRLPSPAYVSNQPAISQLHTLRWREVKETLLPLNSRVNMDQGVDVSWQGLAVKSASGIVSFYVAVCRRTFLFLECSLMFFFVCFISLWFFFLCHREEFGSVGVVIFTWCPLCCVCGTVQLPSCIKQQTPSILAHPNCKAGLKEITFPKCGSLYSSNLSSIPPTHSLPDTYRCQI